MRDGSPEGVLIGEKEAARRLSISRPHLRKPPIPTARLKSPEHFSHQPRARYHFHLGRFALNDVSLERALVLMREYPGVNFDTPLAEETLSRNLAEAV